jgi:ribosomal protein S10
MFINIYIYSKNYNSINRFLIFVRNYLLFNDKLKIEIKASEFPRRIKKKKFTVLKSPHVNKIAQEQFEYYFCKKQIVLNSYKSLFLLVILKKIRTKLFSDLNIKIKLNNDNFLLNSKILNHLNPNNYQVSNVEKKNLLHVKNYLLLFDHFGEVLLKKKV